MEMQDVPKEKQKEGGKGASEAKTGEGAEDKDENELYAKLQNLPEDVYSSVNTAGKQSKGNVRWYRFACLILAVICLVLLVAVIILSIRYGSGSASCPEIAQVPKITSSPDGTCSLQMCQAMLPPPQECPCQQCQRGWLLFGRFCLFLSTLKLDWNESQQNCTSRGGTLAIITSQKLQTFLVGKDTRKFWIGLTQKGTGWMWVNGAALGTSYWAAGPQEGECGALRGGSEPQRNWIQIPCDKATYFICQKELKCHLPN